MEDYRSKSYREGMMQIQNYYGGGRPTSSYAYSSTTATTNSYGSRDVGSYSASYASQTQTQYQTQMGMGMGNKDVKLKKGGSKDGGNSSSSSSSKIWNLNDPEFQRKKRVASYKMYAVEGKMKGSFRRSLRWLKDRYTQVVYGWW